MSTQWHRQVILEQDENGYRHELMTLNVGPSHPVTHGTVRFLMVLDGENIIKLDPQIGYLHRGFEKSAENATYTQVIPYTDRFNYASNLCNNVGYVLAVEKLLDITTTPRCQWIRMLCCELHRMSDHFTALAATGMELGAFTVFFFAVQAREYLYFLTEMLTGARVTTSYTRIGGLAADLPSGFKEAWEEYWPIIERNFHDIDKLLTKNRIYVDRLMGVGAISAEDAIEHSFTGPAIRASGVPYDIRTAHPYLYYDQVEFDVPVGSNGDSYDRYLIRLDEIRQSRRIIEQCFKYMEPGPIMIDDWKVVLPPKKEVYNSIEAMIAHFKLIMDGIRVPPGEVYSYTEAANGELGFYIMSDGSGIPYRIHMRAPCFPLVAAMPYMLRGQMFADLIPTFDTINMIGGEIDR